MDESVNQNAQELAAELTIAWLSNSNTRAQAADVRDFLQSMYEAVSALATVPAVATANEQAAEEYKPATTARRSLSSPEHIVSLIDGKPYKTLRRHLSRHGLTPDQYRERYGLKPDYPMVAPAYAEVRRAMAKKIGLGRKPRIDAPVADTKPAKRGRKPAVEAE
jgi:predicted transcriptional regulator